jgi:hypothetical protein
MNHRTWVRPELQRQLPDSAENMECIREVQQEVLGDLDGLRLLDFDPWVCPDGPDECDWRTAAAVLEDGIHPRPDAAENGRAFIIEALSDFISSDPGDNPSSHGDTGQASAGSKDTG